MSSASKLKPKEKKAGKEPLKVSSKPAGHACAASGMPVGGYNPFLGKFHTLEAAPLPSASPFHVSGSSRNIDETDDQYGSSVGTGMEYDNVSNNGSWSGESEDHKERTSHPLRQEVTPGVDNDKREKIRQKNERKHQRQKEKRAQELHERCSGFLMSRKLEALSNQLVAMGFSSERATLALILNEGKIEESVAWLLEGGGEEDKHKEHNLDGGNLKIDISEEMARISDMEIRFKCSKQEVERAIVACEGDLEDAEETLRVQKQDPPSMPPKPEEIVDSTALSIGKLSVYAIQNSSRAQPKPNVPASIQQWRDEKDFSHTKTAVSVGLPVESVSKNVQALRKVQPKLEWEKPQPTALSADRRWPSAGSNPSVSYSLTSPLQAVTPPAKMETPFVAFGSQLKNLQLGSVKEPVVVMQRPQSGIARQAPSTSASSSPPGTASGWYPSGVELNPSGLSPQIPPSTRNVIPNSLSLNQLYNQHHYQPQVVPSSGPVDSLGASRGNGLWNRMGMSPTVAAASNLGLFSGTGLNSSSGSPSPVDWNVSGSMLQLDYMNIDWSLDRGSSNSRSSGMRPGMTSSVMQSNAHMYDRHAASGMSARTARRPALAHGTGVPLVGLQEGGVAAEMLPGGVSHDWASPFEERDLFSLPRQFVSFPSL